MSEVISLDRSEIESISKIETAVAVMREKYLPLTIGGVDDKKGFDAVYKARQDVKSTRVAVEKKRKELKADALEFGRLVDGAAKRITDLLTPIEDHLKLQEDEYNKQKEAIKKAAEEAAAAKLQSRIDSLIAVRAIGPFPGLAVMPDDVFEGLLAAKTAENVARIAAEEAERLEREKAEAEIARQRAEEQVKLEAERARLADERAKQEAALAAERARLEEEKRSQEELAAKARAEQEALLAKARADQEAAMAEERARIDAEKRAQEESAAKARAEQEAERLRLEAEQRSINAQKAAIEATNESDYVDSLMPGATSSVTYRPALSDSTMKALAKASEARDRHREAMGLTGPSTMSLSIEKQITLFAMTAAEWFDEMTAQELAK